MDWGRPDAVASSGGVSTSTHRRLSADCDLFNIVKGKWIELLPLIKPLNLNVQHKENSLVVLSLQARANEADSAILCVQISWDGKWEDGAQEMKRHLIAKVLNE